MKKSLRNVLFLVLMLAVLAALVWYGDAAKVAAVVGRFRRIYVLWFLFLLLTHEVVRGVLWHFLLRALSGPLPLRAEVFAFAAGEAAKVVPTGAYLQNYLLQRSTGTDFGRSSAATTAIILGEIVVALVGVAALGVGSWSLGLQLSIAVILVAGAVLVRAYIATPHAPRAPRWMRRYRILDRPLEELRRLRAGSVVLAQRRIVIVTLLLSALYVLLDGAGLYIVVRALGIAGVSFWQAVAVKCFGLAFYLVLGSLEAADVGAFVGLGVSKSAAVSAVLVDRTLGIGVTIVLAVLVMFILRGEWRAVRGLQPGAGPADAMSARTAETTSPRGSAC